MQTFKTAVIVVLMLTVVYGAYVSLTTPPTSVPDEIAYIIETDPAFASGAENSYEALGISDGELDLDPFNQEGSLQGTADGGVVGSLSDAGEDLAMSDLDSAGSTPSATPLPKPTAGSVLPSVDRNRSYESTGSATFQLPDPNTLAPPMNDLPADVEGLAMPGELTSNEPAAGGLAMPDIDSLGSDAGRAPARPAADPEQAADSDTATSGSPNVGLANAILAADQHVEADRMKDALATLSMFYNAPGISASDRTQLLSRLDPLAGEVIYSRLHLLEQPYRVEQNETLMEIAAKYEVPWQLLANINGIEDPVVVLPGTELKVVRGPFRAEVDMQRSEMTLMLGELYAGRFPITLGQDPAPQPGTYTVQDKQTAKAFYDATGAVIPPGDPRNPFGTVWLDLGQQMCIHGSSSTGDTLGKGCIALKAKDADDVYGILSQGSTISIRR